MDPLLRGELRKYITRPTKNPTIYDPSITPLEVHVLQYMYSDDFMPYNRNLCLLFRKLVMQFGMSIQHPTLRPAMVAFVLDFAFFSWSYQSDSYLSFACQELEKSLTKTSLLDDGHLFGALLIVLAGYEVWNDGGPSLNHLTRFLDVLRRLDNVGNSRFKVFWPMARDEIARVLFQCRSYVASIDFCRNARALLGGAMFRQRKEYERQLGTGRHDDGHSSTRPDRTILGQHSVQLLECLWKTAVQQQEGLFDLDLDPKTFLTTAKDDLSDFRDSNLDAMLDELESERVILVEAWKTSDRELYYERYEGLIDSVTGCYMLPLCWFLIEALEAPSIMGWLQSIKAQIKAASLIRGLRRIEQMRVPDSSIYQSEYISSFDLKTDIHAVLWIPALAGRLPVLFPDCNSSHLKMI